MEKPENEELIAYLDGELDPRTSQQVEERLKHDPAYRQALTQYERSWDMLDRLERATVGDSFSRTTMEMVSLAAEEEQQHAPRFDASLLRRAGVIGLALVVALALGYQTGRALWPDPNQQLLQDLPILEEFDLYELYAQGGSIDFLHKLENSGLFKHAAGDAKTPDVSLPESPEERLTKITHLSSAEREQLARKLDRFMEYSPQEQLRLRNLHESLGRGSDGAALRDVLVRYHEWLDELPSGVREKLNGLSEDDRITQIATLRQKGSRNEQWNDVTEQDLSVVTSWLDDFAWKHREDLFATVSAKRREFLEGMDEMQQRRALRWMAQHRGSGFSLTTNLFPTPAEIAHLAERLSPKMRARLDAAPNDLERESLIHQWGQVSQAHQKITVGLPRVLPAVPLEELKRFDREELSSEQQKAYQAMPAIRKFHQLLALYLLPVDRVAAMTPKQITAGLPLRATPPPRRGTAGPSEEKR